jgi:hypothetical protein
MGNVYEYFLAIKPKYLALESYRLLQQVCTKNQQFHALILVDYLRLVQDLDIGTGLASSSFFRISTIRKSLLSTGGYLSSNGGNIAQ